MRIVSAFIFVALIASSAWAQKTWTGSAGDGLWTSASNWSGGAVPTAADDVLLDNTNVSGSYTVTIPFDSSLGKAIARSIQIGYAGNVNTITLYFSNNAKVAGFKFGDSTAGNLDFSVDRGGVFINASNAASGSTYFQRKGTADSLRVKSGGKFVQVATASFSTPFPAANSKFDEGSTFELNVRAGATSTPTVSGRTWGNYVVAADSAGGTRTYSGAFGSGALTALDTWTVKSGATLSGWTTNGTHTVKNIVFDGSMSYGTSTGSLTITGDVTVNGTWTTSASQPITFNGASGQSIGGTSSITFNDGLTMNNSAGITLGTSVTVNGVSTMTTGNINTNGNTLTVNDTLDAGTNIITGTGGVTIASGATFITADTGGVYGTVQASSVSFSSAANYTFDGTSAQMTSVGMPSTVNNLTINNSAGVTLSQSTTASMLYFTNGTLATGASTLVVTSGFSGHGSGKFVEGNLAVPVGSTGGYIFPLGQGSDYLPVTLNFNSLTGSDNVAISAVDKSSTPPGGPLGSNQVLNRYFKVAKGSGITAFSADVSFSYSDADVASAGATESALMVFQWDGAQWHPLATSINTTANTADVSGLTSFSDFVLSGTSDTPLPVTMKSLSASIDAGKVRLVFSTATEINIAGFNILRATSKAGPFDLASSYTSNAALKAAGTATHGGSYSFVDPRVSSGKMYFYKIDAVGNDGLSQQVGGLLQVEVTAPKEFAVYQNYPNPFNPTTTIRFDLKEQSNVRLEVYNVLGMKVSGQSFQKEAGTFETQLDFSSMPSGIYYYRVMITGRSGSSFVSTKKMLLVK